MQDNALLANECAKGPVPIHQSAYRSRRTEFLVLSVLLLGVFVPACASFAWHWLVEDLDETEKVLLLVPTVLFGTFAVIGGIMLRRYLVDHTKPLVIDASGVRHGRKHFAWADIGSLRGEVMGKGRSGFLQLVLRERGRLLSGRTLSTTPGLTLDEHERLMERLQREISPAHPHLNFTGPDAPLTPVMRAVFGFFMALAACGLVLSMVVHALALAGVSVVGEDLFWRVGVGIAVVWIPMMVASAQMTRSVPRGDFWKVAMAGCPVWMRRAFHVLFFYAGLNFILVAVIWKDQPKQEPGAEVPASRVRLFSGHWMVFYGAAFAVLYSRVHGCGRPFQGSSIQAEAPTS